jgi:hypothetical protein
VEKEGLTIAEHENVQLIKDHFAAFGRGDIQSALRIEELQTPFQVPWLSGKTVEIIWTA